MCKSCNIEKVTDFTHFEQKNTHISECKIVHKCTRAIVNVQICTVTIALAFNILIISNSLLFFSLSFPSAKPTHSLPHHVLSSSDTHTPTNTKSTTKIKNQPQNQPLEQNRWIGDW